MDATLQKSEFIDIVFDGAPGHVPAHFVEVENHEGRSIRFGETSYDGIRDTLTSPVVLAKLAAADAAILRVEGR